MAARYCPYNGERACCVHCVCVREKRRLHLIRFVILSISSVLVTSHLMLFLMSVVPLFMPLKRSQMVLGQLPLERFFVDYLPNVYLSLYFQKHLVYYLPFTFVWGYLLVVNPLFIQLAASKVIIQFDLTASGFFVDFSNAFNSIDQSVIFREIC